MKPIKHKEPKTPDLWAIHVKQSLRRSTHKPEGDEWITATDFSIKARLGLTTAIRYLKKAVQDGEMECAQRGGKKCWYRPKDRK